MTTIAGYNARKRPEIIICLKELNNPMLAIFSFKSKLNVSEQKKLRLITFKKKNLKKRRENTRKK